MNSRFRLHSRGRFWLAGSRVVPVYDCPSEEGILVICVNDSLLVELWTATPGVAAAALQKVISFHTDEFTLYSISNAEPVGWLNLVSMVVTQP